MIVPVVFLLGLKGIGWGIKSISVIELNSECALSRSRDLVNVRLEYVIKLGTPLDVPALVVLIFGIGI